MVEETTRKKDKEPSFWGSLFIIVLGAFAAVLNNSSVNVAIPKLMAIFGVDADRIQWVVTSYTLTSGMVVPVCAYLVNKFGDKRVFVAGLSVFTAGSVLCSMSWSASTLIASRVVQAIGGGVVMPVSMTIVYRIVPRKKIGIALGVWGMAMVVGPAIGPTLGGYIIDNFNWRLLFTMNIPAGVMGVLLSELLLSSSQSRTGLKFDFWGFIYSATGLFALLLALSEGHKEGWTSYYIIMLFVASFFLLALFVITELIVDEPLLDLRLLKKMAFTMSVLATGLATVGLFGGVFLTPLFAQNILGLTPYQTGLLLMPASLVTALMMPVSGMIYDRIGALVPGFAGIAVTAACTWELTKLTVDSSGHYITLVMMIRAVGLGLAMMPLTNAGMAVIPRQMTAGASSLNNTFRMVFASLGIAVLTATMTSRQAFHYLHMAEGVSLHSPVAVSFFGMLQGYMAMHGMSSAQAGGGAAAVLYGIVQKAALVQAIDDAFVVATVFVAAALPMIMFLSPSRTTRRGLGHEKEM